MKRTMEGMKLVERYIKPQNELLIRHNINIEEGNEKSKEGKKNALGGECNDL